jgi:glycerol-3-phosphate acyltransferase PlsY
MPSAVLWLVVSYLMGAIPTSYLLSRFFAGIDLRQHGSGNLGATNLYRVLGWKYAIPAAVWAVMVRITGYVSLASISAAAVLPVAVYLLEDRTPALFWIAAAIAAAVIVLHRRNIERLLKGTESRFGRRATSTPNP